MAQSSVEKRTDHQDAYLSDTQTWSTYLGSSFARLASYRQQLIYTRMEPPATDVLVVGGGDGLVPDILRSDGMNLTISDIREDLNPDLVADVRDIPRDDNVFDLTICCQVLEHIPFDQVPIAFQELARVTRRRIVISIPDSRRFMSFNLRILKFAKHFQASPPRLTKKKFPSTKLEELGHYWEAGYEGIGLNEVAQACTAPGWHLTEHTRVVEMPWHLFLVFDATGPTPPSNS